jgi:hypothetical protein
MDVYRQRSQVAIVDDAGVPQRNPNLANDPAKLIPVLGGLPPGTPVAFEAAYGWAGWSTCWRNWSWSRTWSIPAAARPSPRPGARTTRSMRPPWPSCSGLICCPRPGSRLRPHGICGPCCVTGPPWSGCRPRSRTGCMRCWPTVASPKTGACGLVLGGLGRQAWSCRRPRGDHPGRRWAAGRPGHPIARREREIATLAKPDPRVQALLALPV